MDDGALLILNFWQNRLKMLKLKNWQALKCWPRQRRKFQKNLNHGRTLANRTKPGLSLQVYKWQCLCCLLMFLLSKTAKLKIENLAQTTFRFSHVRYRAPRLNQSANQRWLVKITEQFENYINWIFNRVDCHLGQKTA